jgi:hypothetical protein
VNIFKAWIVVFCGIVLAAPFLGYCDKELKYVHIRPNMQNIFNYHIENKEFSPFIVKRSFKIYLEQFDCEKLYLLKEEVLPLIGAVVSPLDRDFFLQKISEETGIDKMALEKETLLETVVEVKEEIKEDKPADQEDLSSFSDSVQKRIDKLTRKMREAERREQAALDYAQGLQKKYTDAQKKYQEIDDSYIKQYDARIDAEKDTVKKKLKEAIESQDAEAIISANEELSRLIVEKERAKVSIAAKERQKKDTEQNEKEAQNVEQNQQVERKAVAPSTKAKKWAEDNTWFGSDEYMTNTAFQVHEKLQSEGFDLDSDEYYNEINKQMKDIYPHKFAEDKQEQKKPVQTVASANRGKTGRRTVRLTKSQVAIAKKLGVPLEEYAKYVKEAN